MGKHQVALGRSTSVNNCINGLTKFQHGHIQYYQLNQPPTNDGLRRRKESRCAFRRQLEYSRHSVPRNPKEVATKIQFRSQSTSEGTNERSVCTTRQYDAVWAFVCTSDGSEKGRNNMGGLKCTHEHPFVDPHQVTMEKCCLLCRLTETSVFFRVIRYLDG